MPEAETGETPLDLQQNRHVKFFEARADGRPSPGGRLVTVLIIAAAFWAIIYAFQTGETEPAIKLPPEIEALNPVQDAKTVPKQSTVTVDFRFGITGELNIDGITIPPDETVYEPAQALLSFSPGEGKVMRVIQGGVRRATVSYWPVGSTRELAGRSFSWTFTVI